MRIAIVAGYAPSLVNFRAPLLQALRQRGHEVIALAPPEAGGSFEGNTRPPWRTWAWSWCAFPCTGAG